MEIKSPFSTIRSTPLSAWIWTLSSVYVFLRFDVSITREGMVLSPYWGLSYLFI